MSNPVTDFMENAKSFTRNPLGIIALFVSLIYGFACLVLSTGLDKLSGPDERLPLIWFIICFPVLILGAFTYLVMRHHKKLYGPMDYKDEKNFVNTFIGNKEVTSDLEKVNVQLKSILNEKPGSKIVSSINKISDEIEKIKEKSEKIPINSSWTLNHWGSNCATISGDKMIFTGTSASPNGADGSHINLTNMLEIGKTYEISCFAKSAAGTNAMFQLWCHDEIGPKPNGMAASTTYKIPSIEGEKIKVDFKATYNSNIRIHLQYKPGQGSIEISDVKISELRG